MDRLHRALLRPTGAQGGLRPPARGGGSAAVLTRALLLAIALWSSVPSVASADTVGTDTYITRLVTARGFLDRARNPGVADRAGLLARAREQLRETTALRTRDGTVPVDDSAVIALIDGADGPARAIAVLDAYIVAAQRASRELVNPADADARLREILGQTQEQSSGAGGAVGAILAWIAAWLTELVGGMSGVPDLRFVPFVIAGLGIALVLFIVATLGRGLRERIRQEVLVSDRPVARGPDPSAHLRLAESAIAGGRAREAIHELYLYVIASLAAREVIRYDPALTDRELLSRAAAIPNIDALRELVALYERAWFGLREPDAAEAERARRLAARLAA